MQFGGDERAQSVLVGSILLFAMLIIAFSTYQAFVVPSQNAEVEFSHSQQVENEFSELRSNVVNAVESGDERSTSITLGTRYPSRLLALNPPAPAGAISTTDPEPIDIDGDAGPVNVCSVGETTTRSLVYEPGYNEYRDAESTVYENTFVATTFRDGEPVPRTQRLIRDGRIDLLVLTGDISTSRTTAYGIDVNATHRYSYGTVEDPVVTLPSQFTAETWETRILEEREDVSRVTDTGDGRVRIELDGSFDVTCAVAGLNSDPAFQPPGGTDDGVGSGGGGGETGGSDGGSNGGGDPPAVDQLTADLGSGNSYNVNYQVSDSDAELVTVELILEAQDGTEIDSATAYDDGETDRVQGNNGDLKNTGPNDPYRVRLVATDAAGNTAEATDTV